MKMMKPCSPLKLFGFAGRMLIGIIFSQNTLAVDFNISQVPLTVGLDSLAQSIVNHVAGSSVRYP